VIRIHDEIAQWCELHDVAEVGTLVGALET
jgi:hypothetical protein